MGNLPADRVTQARPFFNSGVDYCGPIWIHHKLRGKRPDKAYIAVFCCFATKAVHLELVSDLTTDAFLAALRQFLGRRGKCQTIHCDNATNFVGANNQLKPLEGAIFTDKAQEQIINHCNKKQVEFKFIPPRAPSFGGLWEAAVKSAKQLLVSVTATSSLAFEELNTVIVEVEAILNSRPLTPMSSDPTDTSALTPGHFMIGEPLTAAPDANLSSPGKRLVKRWELVSRLKQMFWDQWSMEYLQELQMRNKWKTASQNVKEGLLVLVKEDNVPVMSWPMGRIVKTYPGKDDHVRVVNVKTASGIFKRSVTRLAPLLKEETAVKRPHSSVEDTTSKDEMPTQRRKVSPSILPTLLAMLLILPLAMGQQTKVTHFTNQPGLFYERIGTSRMAISEWTIIVYYDLQPYWSDMRHLHAELLAGNELINHSRQRRSPLDIVDIELAFLTLAKSSSAG
nr:uncharacterized protein LOC121502075 [Drosophila kikkawai]